MPWKIQKLNPTRSRISGGWACVLLNLLICSSVQTSAFAQKIDTNCNRYREKWPDGSMKPANGPWARDFFIKNQKDLITQQGALKLYDAEVGDCLRKTSGVGFEGGNLTILDPAKFKTFRLSGDVPQCNINTVVFASSIMKDKHPYSTSDTILETAVGSVSDPRLRSEMRHQANRNAFDDNQARVSSELEKARNTLKDLSDLSLKNYCGQQFYDKNLRDEFKRLQEKNSACLKKFRADPGSIKGDKDCAGWPDQIKSDSSKMKAGVDLLNQNKVLNEFDKGLYSEFANDATALDKAIADAKKEYTKKSWEYETLRKNNALLPPSNLKGCAKDSKDASNLFNNALCAGDRHPASNLKGFIADNPKVMNTQNRKNLINDANKRIFSNVVEGAVLTASPSDLGRLSTPASSSAARIAKLRSFCTSNGMDLKSKACTTDEYAKILEKSSKLAAPKRSKHFLSQPDSAVAAGLAAHYSEIVNACRMPASPDREAEVRHLVEKLYGDQSVGPFALSDHMRSFTETAGKGGCGGATQLSLMTDPSNLSYDLKAARKEYRDLIKEQLQTCANNGLPDYGYQNRGWITQAQNHIGAMECNADLAEKNAMTALYDQFITYPTILSESLKGMGEQDQQIYSQVICGAMNCHQQIKDTNAAMMNGARVTLLVAGCIFTGGIGAAAVLTTGAVLEAGNAANEIKDLNHEKDALMKGVSSGGYPTGPWINEKIAEIKAEKRAVITEAAVNTAFYGLNVGAFRAVKTLRIGKTGAAAEVAGEVMASRPIQALVSKALSKMPHQVQEIAYENLRHHVQHSVKEASADIAKLEGRLLDGNGELTLEGIKVFGDTLLKKVSVNLLAFGAGADPKLHEGSLEEDYLRLLEDGMNAYEGTTSNYAPEPITEKSRDL